MTPLERFLLEGIPTRPPPPRPPAPPWTPAEQDAHWQALCAAVGTPGARRPRLRLVPTPQPCTDRHPDKEISQ